MVMVVVGWLGQVGVAAGVDAVQHERGGDRGLRPAGDGEEEESRVSRASRLKEVPYLHESRVSGSRS